MPDPRNTTRSSHSDRPCARRLACRNSVGAACQHYDVGRRHREERARTQHEVGCRTRPKMLRLRFRTVDDDVYEAREPGDFKHGSRPRAVRHGSAAEACTTGCLEEQPRSG